jgi:pentatricopeptide repeat protein
MPDSFGLSVQQVLFVRPSRASLYHDADVSSFHVQFLREMDARSIKPNARSYTIAVDACGRGGEWRRALALLEEMEIRGIPANVSTFGALLAISYS